MTDVGRRRKLNEDNFLVDAETNLFSVCDGMGGHNAGEVASKMAIETLDAFIRKSAGEEKDITWPYGLERELSFEANRLKTAIKPGQQARLQGRGQPRGLHGHGHHRGGRARQRHARSPSASAGDSRCYLLRGGQLKQLTRDDSWVSAAWAEGHPDARRDRRATRCAT